MVSYEKNGTSLNLDIRRIYKEKIAIEGKNIKTNKNRCIICGFTFSTFVFVFSLLATYILWATDLYNTQILKTLTLSDGDFIFKMWQNPGVENFIYVYPFNYTNFKEILYFNEIPKVEEKGPYVFRERIVKENIEFSGTEWLTYSENRSHEFVPELSNGDLSEYIEAPNVPYISAVSRAGESSMFVQFFMSTLLKGTGVSPFTNTTVEDFIMGFDDSFSVVARQLAKTFKGETPSRFGILNERNGLSRDRITIGTGIPNLNKLSIVHKINGKDSLEAWDGESCNNITGSDGNLVPGKTAEANETLYMFARGFCRRIPLTYFKDTITDDGVPARRFVLSDDVFTYKIPDDACYCRDECPRSGTFSIQPCNFGAPIYLSFPHFMNGDPALFKDILGLNPDPQKHGFFLDIHKTLGIPLAGRSRFQISIKVNWATHMPQLKSIKQGTILPLAWVDLSVGKPNQKAQDIIYHATFTAAQILITLQWLSLFISIISFLTLCYLINRCCKS